MLERLSIAARKKKKKRQTTFVWYPTTRGGPAARVRSTFAKGRGGTQKIL